MKNVLFYCGIKYDRLSNCELVGNSIPRGQVVQVCFCVSVVESLERVVFGSPLEVQLAPPLEGAGQLQVLVLV